MTYGSLTNIVGLIEFVRLIPCLSGFMTLTMGMGFFENFDNLYLGNPFSQRSYFLHIEVYGHVNQLLCLITIVSQCAP